LSDNGSDMLAEETSQGLSRLGILQFTTLRRSSYQNGKQEVFFSQVEGRLLAMLKGTPNLSLRLLNESCWCLDGMEYQRSKHDGIDTSPVHRFMQGKNHAPPQLNASFGLKWNPFSPDVPTPALWLSPALEHFCRRMDNVSSHGGFALISGKPGTGKSVALRLLHHYLAGATDRTVAVLTRPQSRLADFYRELGQLFGLSLAPHNRWAGFSSLREKWWQHIHSTGMRPVLLVDEAQEERHSSVLAEIRLPQHNGQ